jgi:hypothetical protein
MSLWLAPQEGVEAPPEEEVPADLAEEGVDFSFATMFAAQASLEPAADAEPAANAEPRAAPRAVEQQAPAEPSALGEADPWTVFPGSATAESVFARVRRSLIH